MGRVTSGPATKRFDMMLTEVERVGIDILLAQIPMLVSRAALLRYLVVKELRTSGHGELAQAIMNGATIAPEAYRITEGD